MYNEYYLPTGYTILFSSIADSNGQFDIYLKCPGHSLWKDELFIAVAKINREGAMLLKEALFGLKDWKGRSNVRKNND